MVRVAPILLCSVFILMFIQYCAAPSSSDGTNSWLPSFSFKKSSNNKVKKKDVVEQTTNAPGTPTEGNTDAPYKAYHETEAAQDRPYVPRGLDSDYGWRQGANELLDLKDPNEQQEEKIQYAPSGRGEFVRAEYGQDSTPQQWRF